MPSYAIGCILCNWVTGRRLLLWATHGSLQDGEGFLHAIGWPNLTFMSTNCPLMAVLNAFLNAFLNGHSFVRPKHGQYNFMKIYNNLPNSYIKINLTLISCLVYVRNIHAHLHHTHHAHADCIRSAMSTSNMHETFIGHTSAPRSFSGNDLLHLALSGLCMVTNQHHVVHCTANTRSFVV